IDDGLPGAVVYSLLETKEGLYWIATNRGLVRFDPLGTRGAAKSGRPMFTTFLLEADPRAHEVWVLLQDGAGTGWIGTPLGLYRVNNSGTAPIASARIDVGNQANCLAEDGAGGLWIGTQIGLVRRVGHRRTARVSDPVGVSANVRNALLVGSRGGVL